MALQSSGAISINDIAGEFGGTTPHALNEYYGVDSGIPASGAIKIGDFYGATNIKDHAFRLLLSANNSNSVTVTMPTGVALTSNDPVCVCTMITWDGVANSVSSPSINGGAPTWTYNSGAGSRGYTLTCARAVPAGTTFNCSFTPGGGWDFRAIIVYAVFDVPQVTPDLIYKTTNGTLSQTVSGTTYDSSSVIVIKETWQAGMTAVGSGMANAAQIGSQGTVQVNYNPTTRNNGSDSVSETVNVSETYSTAYSEGAGLVLAWNRSN